jgi:hypothetical protein
MRLAIAVLVGLSVLCFVLATVAFCGCQPQPVGSTMPPMPPVPVVDDAGSLFPDDAAPGVHEACTHLCKAGCATWCSTDVAGCERDLPNLLESGLNVNLGCLATTTDCDAKGCVQ